MTVAELIAVLQQMDQDAEVRVEHAYLPQWERVAAVEVRGSMNDADYVSISGDFN